MSRARNGDLPAEPSQAKTSLHSSGVDASRETGYKDGGDSSGESCGVFGAYTPLEDATMLTYRGLFALQHRGQESAGIAVSDGENITVHKDLGLVAQVFDEAALGALSAHLAMGHTRYSTTGSTRWENAQPTFRQVEGTFFALGHNGNLTNTETLAAELPGAGAFTDSELMAEAIAQRLAREPQRDLEVALLEALPDFEGAFSLVILDQKRLIGVRDPRGFRPLCLGRLPAGWVLASETAALDIAGAKLVRDIEPGEVVVIDGGEPRSFRPFPKERPSLCLFEFVYFSRPDSVLSGSNVHLARRRMGEALAKEAPAVADVVVPVPESGIPAAQGYAMASSIPYSDGLVKNRYVGRTFIEPAQSERHNRVRLKLNPMPAVLEGNRVVLVDDSIVRGTTTRRLVEIVRLAGAIEVHMRVSSPPYRWPCFYGMDTSDRTQLLAAHRSVEEVQEFLGVDSLEYLSLHRLIEATGAPPEEFCSACLTGTYPTEIPAAADKLILERQH